MAKTNLVDDRAAYRLLEAVFKQARRDIKRPTARPEHRIEAYELFRTVAMVEGDNDGVPDISYRARGGYRVSA
jgi:hypothetical protein